MKLGQMRRIQRLVAEHAVNREQFLRHKCRRLRSAVQHARAHCRCVRAEQVLRGLLDFPVIAVALENNFTYFWERSFS